MNGNEFVALLRRALTRLHDEAGAFMQGHGADPFPGSVAANERAGYPRPDVLLSAAAIATILIESVGEHLTAFVKTITEPVEPIACWTCVRSMLESASIAAWLLDTGIDAQTRVGRSFAHRNEGMDQQGKLLKVLNSPASDLQRLEDHVNDFENVAAGLGFPRLRNKKGERIGIGRIMPSATDIIKVMLDEERAYRLLSAVAHGHVWAIHQLGFTSIAEVVSPEGVPATVLTKHSGTVEGYGFLATCAAKSFALPVWNQCLYLGWDKDRLARLLESVYDEFGGLPSIRFWRPPAAPQH